MSGLQLSSHHQFFPKEFTILLHRACCLLEQGSERVTYCVKGEESLAKVQLLLFSCLVSTKVTRKIQLLLLTPCTRDGVPITLELQNRDRENRWTKPANCGPHHSTVGLAPGGTAQVETTRLPFWLPHGPRGSAAVCASLEWTASCSAICAA